MAPDESRAQRSGQHRRASLQQVLDRVPVAIGSVDRTLRIRCANRAACRLYGYSAPREILGRRLDEVIGSATFAQYHSTIEAALSGETLVYEADWVDAGVERANEVHLTPQFGPTGAVVGCDYLSIDITARRWAEHAQRTWSQELLLRQEEQRRAVARELHEGISQALTGLNLWLATAGGPDPHVAGAQRMMSGLTERTRTLAVDLRPPELEDFNLLLVLRAALRRFDQRTGIQVQLRADGGGYYVPDPVQTAVFRIVEAALSNVERHADVTEAVVSLTVEAGVLTVMVSDEGRGFDPGRTASGFGFGVMRVWAKMAGGSVTVAAVPGAGVAVTAKVPVA